MHLIKNPWRNMFFDLISSCKRSIKIASPYVKSNIALDIMNSKNESVKVSLITSFRLMNYYTGASDLSALESVLMNNGSIGNVQKLHAKIYIFDDAKAVITSGNLSNGGLTNNFEYGVFFDELATVNEIGSDFASLLSDESTGRITLSEIRKANEIISKIPKLQSINSTLPSY